MKRSQRPRRPEDETTFVATIEEYTTPDPVAVRPETSIQEVMKIFRSFSFRHLPVLENRRAVGVISDRDLLLARSMVLSEKITARDLMTHDPFSARLDASLEEIAFALSDRKVGSVMVYDRNDTFYGIFTATDALNALVETLRAAVGAAKQKP